MAQLSCASGRSFVLDPVRYEYPFMTGDSADANWLVIRLAVVAEAGPWEIEGAFLLTFEAQGLADWLGTVAAGTQPALTWGGTLEDMLRCDVRLLTCGIELQVFFDMAYFYKPWAEWEARRVAWRAQGWDRWIPATYRVTADELADFAETLVEQLCAFPTRALTSRHAGTPLQSPRPPD